MRLVSLQQRRHEEDNTERWFILLALVRVVQQLLTPCVREKEKILIQSSHIYDLHPCASLKGNLLLLISNKSEAQLPCCFSDRNTVVWHERNSPKSSRWGSAHRQVWVTFQRDRSAANMLENSKLWLTFNSFNSCVSFVHYCINRYVFILIFINVCINMSLQIYIYESKRNEYIFIRKYLVHLINIHNLLPFWRIKQGGENWKQA